MKFWQWVLLALVIVGVGSVVRPAAGMAANWDRTASAFTGGGDAWLMGDGRRKWKSGTRPITWLRKPSSRSLWTHCGKAFAAVGQNHVDPSAVE